MIDFPASPTIGATFIDPTTNLAWVWDGTKWVASGLADAPFQPLFGVTDGSNAAPGQIGEVIALNITTGVSLAPTTTAIVVGSIALSAGDWDVSGEVWINNAGATLTLAVGGIYPATTVPGAPQINGSRAQLQNNFNVGGTQVFALRPCRANLTATTTYNLLAMATFASGGPPTANGTILARRVR